MTIYTLTGIAGSGKSENLIRYAQQRLTQHKKTAFVIPTRELCDQTRSRLIATRVPARSITMIYSKRGTDAVGKQLMEHTKHAHPNIGEILICTHAAFFACRHWHRRDLWCPLVDEVMAMHADLGLKLPQNYGLITDLLAPEDLSQKYTRVVPRDAAARERLAKMLDTAMSDVINAQFKDLISRLLDPAWEVQIESANWQRVTAGESPSDTAEIREQRRKLRFYGVMLPSVFDGFDQPVIAAARIEDHLLHKLWRSLGADMRPAQHILDAFGDCTTAEHDGTRLVLRVLTGPGVPRYWSKAFADTVLSDGRTPRETLRAYCEEHLAGQPYLFVTNANPPKQEVPLGSTLLGPHCHGLNQFRQMKAVVIGSALMPDNQYDAFLRSLGVTREDVHRDIAWLTAYQALMRTNLREIGDDRVVCYIMDQNAARYIAALFPGCTVERIDILAAPVSIRKVGRPASTLTPEQRCAKRNARLRLKRAAARANKVPAAA